MGPPASTLAKTSQNAAPLAATLAETSQNKAPLAIHLGGDKSERSTARNYLGKKQVRTWHRSHPPSFSQLWREEEGEIKDRNRISRFIYCAGCAVQAVLSNRRVSGSISSESDIRLFGCYRCPNGGLSLSYSRQRITAVSKF